MKLAFEFNVDPQMKFKQRYCELICKFKGHKWEKWEKPKPDRGYLGILTNIWFDTDELMDGKKRDKQCTRCYEITYKKVKEKPRTISFRKYSDLTNQA